MKWVRWRNHFAYGTNRWEYKPLYVNKLNDDFKEMIQEEMQDRADEYSWSDKYRRIEWEFLETRQVPNKHIEKAYNDLSRQIEYWAEAINTGGDRLFILEKLKGKGRKTCPDEIEKAKRDKRYKKIIEKRRKEEEKKRQLSSDG